MFKAFTLKTITHLQGIKKKKKGNELLYHDSRLEDSVFLR